MNTPNVEAVNLDELNCWRIPEGGLPGWPHQVDLTLSIRLDEQLHISLTSHNQSAETVTISQALHSYFAVSDVRNVHVEGVDGLSYIETLDDWKTVTQSGDLRSEERRVGKE